MTIATTRVHIDILFRQRILNLLEKLQESLQLTDVLQTAITRKHSVFEEACSKFLNAMSPRQTVAFLLWIEKHNLELSKVSEMENRKYGLWVMG